MKHTIRRIDFNWFYSNEAGEEYNVREAGCPIDGKKVIKITEHPAAGEGDKWYYDVHFEDGSIERIFNPNRVFKSPEDQQ